MTEGSLLICERETLSSLGVSCQVGSGGGVGHGESGEKELSLDWKRRSPGSWLWGKERREDGRGEGSVGLWESISFPGPQSRVTAG